MRRLLFLMLAASTCAFAQTNWPVSITDNLPTATTYSDSASAAPAGSGGVSLTDTLVATMTYGDRTQILKGKDYLLRDTVSYSDSTAYTHGLNLPAEQFTESDQPSTTHDVSGGGGVASSVVPADNILVAVTYNDAITAVKNAGGAAHPITPSESFALTDVVNRGLAIKPSDSLLVTTSVCANGTFPGLRDSLAYSDRVQVNAFTGGLANSRMPADPLTESDSVFMDRPISNVLLADNLTESDVVLPRGVNSFLAPETFSFSDSISVPRPSNSVETFQFSDAALVLGIHIVKVSEAFVFTDGIFAPSSNGKRKGQLLISSNQGLLP